MPDATNGDSQTIYCIYVRVSATHLHRVTCGGTRLRMKEGEMSMCEGGVEYGQGKSDSMTGETENNKGQT